MMRRSLILVGTAAIMFLHSPAQAQESVADDVIARIEAEGYSVDEVKRSWLGRIVITASDHDELREVVLNRTSGEILRDQRFVKDPNGDKRPASQPSEPDEHAPLGEPNAHGGPKGKSKSDGPKDAGGHRGKGKNGG